MHQFASQHTESFAAFLRAAGVSLAVSTYQSGQLVLLRPLAEGLDTHFIAMPRPMGIAVDGARLTLGAAHRIEFFRNMPAVAKRLGPERPDAVFVHRATHVTGDIDVHEMGYDRDGELWLVNTRMSCLCTLAADSSVVPRWKPPFISRYDLLDRCHLNGLGVRDGHPRYVSMLGHGNEPGSWRRDKAKGGRIMDLTDDSVIADGLCMPHSPRWHRGQLWFLASGEGRLMRLGADGSMETVAEVPGFARGLAFLDRYALVGLSQVRESAVFAGLPLTARVEERQCGVHLIDIESGAVVGLLRFSGEVQEIFDVQILPHRAPVLLDAESPLLASTYELPEAALRLLAPADPVQEALAAATRLQAGGALEEAIAAYRRIAEAQPQLAQAQHQLGLALSDAEDWQAAVDALQRAIALDPGNAPALNSLALAHARLGRYEAALDAWQRALAIDSQFALARFNRSLILLKLGRFAQGWSDYESRWQLPGANPPLRCPQPQWQGEDIRDQRLLVHSEQGHGDQIQFWRYLKLARMRCRELIYAGPEPLIELAAEVDGVDESRGPGEIPRDRFDCYVPLLSLPVRLGLDDPLPMTAPYVHAPAHVQVRALPGQRLIGLVWRGSPGHKEDRQRSLELADLLPLTRTTNARFYSLQFPVSGKEVEILRSADFGNLEPEILGYARTAAFIEQLDRIITVDTAVAHLAGAMGKPVWILLGSDPDWRWGQQGETTPWYPSARLFRLAPGEPWPSLIGRVAAVLELEA
ncbi:TIGR03032 family protein [Dokdonella immobilis]|uniref:TIGR03032 family protein n=1 Tax=Dokdonella immobilis TaxID=578942 RepID=A0A1I5AEC2_9GAMM|nr:TIGR03032 family protein [Dokdonella immobilis]SFN60831.1 TIGR03032 family protein [Dokdonella immobilis]